jgi:hypothetical protein
LRLLMMNLGMDMAEGVVREELESQNICVQGATQLRYGRRDQDPTKDRPPKPHFIVSMARGPEVKKCVHSPKSAACECRWRGSVS